MRAYVVRVDVIENAPAIPRGPFDLIGMFGVIHHVPGEAARLELLRALAERLTLGGTLAVAPTLVRGATRDLGWVSELVERRKPFAAIVHCLCGEAN